MKVAESKLEAMPLAAPSTTQEKHSLCISVAREYDTLFAQLAAGKYTNSLLLKSHDEGVMRLFTRIHEASVELHAAIMQLVCRNSLITAPTVRLRHPHRP